MSENEPSEENAAVQNERRPRVDLSSKQRKHLRGLAHHLSPLVRVGHEGLTEGLKEAVDEALLRHELIKVKLLESAPIGKKEFAEEVAARCGAHVAGVVGRTVILYRRHPKTPQVRLGPK